MTQEEIHKKRDYLLKRIMDIHRTIDRAEAELNDLKKICTHPNIEYWEGFLTCRDCGYTK